MLHRTSRALALLALTVLTACGGSGGGGGGGGGPVVPTLGDAAFQGDYFTILKAGGHGVTAEARGATGILLADGAGSALPSQVSNDSGTVSGPDTSPYSFDVAADGTLEISIPSGVFARGGISADGECALLGSASSGSFPGIMVLRRRQGFYADSSLSGDYHLALHAFSPTLESVVATGSATFDGGGNATGSLTRNTMGAISSGTLGTTTYSVIADGTSTLTVNGGAVEGGVVGGGAAAIWGGSTTPGVVAGVFIAVKAAASAGLNTLQGAYWIVVLERDPVSDDFRSLHGTATADGVGGLTLAGTSNTEGVLATEPAGATTYTVAADGGLTIDAGGSVLIGGVSADGRFAFAAGGTVAGTDPTLVVLCRK